MNSETQIFSTRGLQGDVAHRAATDRNTGANPFSFRISAPVSFTLVTQHMGPTALRPIWRTKQWSSVLLKDTSVTARDSNPHSADQKHQSLNPVL